MAKPTTGMYTLSAPDPKVNPKPEPIIPPCKELNIVQKHIIVILSRMGRDEGLYVDKENNIFKKEEKDGKTIFTGLSGTNEADKGRDSTNSRNNEEDILCLIAKYNSEEAWLNDFIKKRSAFIQTIKKQISSYKEANEKDNEKAWKKFREDNAKQVAEYGIGERALREIFGEGSSPSGSTLGFHTASDLFTATNLPGVNKMWNAGSGHLTQGLEEVATSANAATIKAKAIDKACKDAVATTNLSEEAKAILQARAETASRYATQSEKLAKDLKAALKITYEGDVNKGLTAYETAMQTTGKEVLQLERTLATKEVGKAPDMLAAAFGNEAKVVQATKALSNSDGIALQEVSKMSTKATWYGRGLRFMKFLRFVGTAAAIFGIAYSLHEDYESGDKDAFENNLTATLCGAALGATAAFFLCSNPIGWGALLTTAVGWGLFGASMGNIAADLSKWDKEGNNKFQRTVGWCAKGVTSVTSGIGSVVKSGFSSIGLCKA